MNPAESGWLKQYIAQKSNHPIHLGKHSDAEKERYLYNLLQPTGLIYGHPIHAPYFQHPKENRWNYFNKMKIVVVDAFIQSAYINYKPQQESINWFNFYTVSVKAIDTYFRKLNVKKQKKPFFPFLRRKKDSLELAEDSIQSVLLIKSGSNFFWTNLFQKSLLFLDTYYFGQWFGNHLKSVQWHKDNMKVLLLEVIMASVKSKHIKQSADKNLLKSFFRGSQLSKEQINAAKDNLKNAKHIEDVDFRMADTWLLKKYVLEILILLIWTDKVIDEKEREFLVHLGARLQLDGEEVDLSLIAIESFVLENWKDVYFLQSKHSFQLISEKLIGRYRKVIHPSIPMIIDAIKDSEITLELIKEFEEGQIEDEKRQKLRLILIDLLKQVENLKNISLPFNFLTVFNLLKIIEWNKNK